MGVIAILHRPITVRCQRKGGWFHTVAGEWTGTVEPSAPEQDQPDEYAVPEDDPDWLMLVELCGEVYRAQGHAGAHSWIEMLPEPYQSEMWRVLEELAPP